MTLLNAVKKLQKSYAVTPAEKFFAYSVIFLLTYYVICDIFISTKENTPRRRKQ
jgi:hypothetical protein